MSFIRSPSSGSSSFGLLPNSQLSRSKSIKVNNATGDDDDIPVLSGKTQEVAYNSFNVKTTGQFFSLFPLLVPESYDNSKKMECLKVCNGFIKETTDVEINNFFLSEVVYTDTLENLTDYPIWRIEKPTDSTQNILFLTGCRKVPVQVTNIKTQERYIKWIWRKIYGKVILNATFQDSIRFYFQGFLHPNVNKIKDMNIEFVSKFLKNRCMRIILTKVNLPSEVMHIWLWNQNVSVEEGWSNIVDKRYFSDINFNHKEV